MLCGYAEAIAQDDLAIAALLDAMVDEHASAVAAKEEQLQQAAAFLSLGALDGADRGATERADSGRLGSTVEAQVHARTRCRVDRGSCAANCLDVRGLQGSCMMYHCRNCSAGIRFTPAQRPEVAGHGCETRLRTSCIYLTAWLDLYCHRPRWQAWVDWTAPPGPLFPVN